MIDFNTIVGIAGMLMLLIAFAMNLGRKLSEDSLGYIILNIAGPGLLAYHATVVSSIPFLILEAVWGLFAIYKLVMVLSKK